MVTQYLFKNLLPYVDVELDFRWASELGFLGTHNGACTNVINGSQQQQICLAISSQKCVCALNAPPPPTSLVFFFKMWSHGGWKCQRITTATLN